HGRVRRRPRQLLHDQRPDTGAGPRAHAVLPDGLPAAGRPRPARPPAVLGGLGPGRLGRGLPAAHALPGGDPLAGLLLPGRLPQARRRELEVLHQLPPRPEERGVGAREGALRHEDLVGSTWGEPTGTGRPPPAANGGYSWSAAGWPASARRSRQPRPAATSISSSPVRRSAAAWPSSTSTSPSSARRTAGWRSTSAGSAPTTATSRCSRWRSSSASRGWPATTR